MGRKRKRSRQTRIIVPARIKERWVEKHHGTKFRLGAAYSKVNVSPEEFKKCWENVQPTLSEDVLFRLFDSTFGSVDNPERKVKFVKHILALHQGTRRAARVRSSCDDGYTKDQVKEQFYRDFNLDSWFEKHAASDGTVSQNQIDMKLVIVIVNYHEDTRRRGFSVQKQKRRSDGKD